MTTTAHQPLFDLTGRLAVVTGARRGIGLAITEALAAAGADIVAVAVATAPAPPRPAPPTRKSSTA
ncbi:SDR family NAD(P)-dependent oxidoreductase [Streptomyces sp. NPDC091377]|uniref:SDR family NAD(P)-dependent oxidoreductase n=1 Tax=Streptomyces sp. NPDC091377 TaxID=3365995 RepID=UPI00380A12B2